MSLTSKQAAALRAEVEAQSIKNPAFVKACKALPRSHWINVAVRAIKAGNSVALHGIGGAVVVGELDTAPKTRKKRKARTPKAEAATAPAAAPEAAAPAAKPKRKPAAKKKATKKTPTPKAKTAPKKKTTKKKTKPVPDIPASASATPGKIPAAAVPGNAEDAKDLM